MMYDTLHAMKACIDRSGVTGKPDDLQKDRDRIRGCFGESKRGCFRQQCSRIVLAFLPDLGI